MNDPTNPKNSAKKHWVKKQAVAEHFQCNIRTVSKLMRAKVLPFCKVGRVLRFNLDDCDSAMEKFKSKSLFDRRGPS